MSSRILVTGSLGCFGIATIRWLLETGHDSFLAVGRSVTADRLRRTFGDESAEKIRPAAISITDGGTLKRAFDDFRPTHVAHFAGLQTPDCQNNPAAGWDTNVNGTENVYRLSTEAGSVERLVAISSAAVYGPNEMYTTESVNEDLPVRKSTVYSRTKIAVELIGERYWELYGRSSLQTRPFVCFGPGRHHGMSAAYTMAIIATALDEAFTMPFAGTYDFTFVPDVGEVHGRLLTAASPRDFAVYNIPGETCETGLFCQLIRQAAEKHGIGQQCRIETGESRIMPTACNLDWSRIRDDFQVTATPLDEAIEATLLHYLAEVKKGRVTSQLLDDWSAANTRY